MRKITLSLSGSGTLFYVHLGVLKALSECPEIEIAEVLGVSGGALTGALWAAYQNYDEVEAIILAQDSSKYFKWGWLAHLGVFDLSRVAKLIDSDLRLSWADLKIPFTTSATAVETGETLYFYKDSAQTLTLGQALQATATIPLVFQAMRYTPPVKYDPRHCDQVHLVDGGILENLLVNAQYELVASYLGFQGVRIAPLSEKFPNAWPDFLMSIWNVLQYRILKKSLDSASLVIDHPYTWDRNFITPKGETEARELIDLAYQRTKVKIAEFLKESDVSD